MCDTPAQIFVDIKIRRIAWTVVYNYSLDLQIEYWLFTTEWRTCGIPSPNQIFHEASAYHNIIKLVEGLGISAADLHRLRVCYPPWDKFHELFGKKWENIGLLPAPAPIPFPPPPSRGIGVPTLDSQTKYVTWVWVPSWVRSAFVRAPVFLSRAPPVSPGSPVL